MILFEFDIDYYVIYPFVIHLLAYWISSTFFIYLDKIYSTYATIGYEKYIRTEPLHTLYGWDVWNYGQQL